MSSKHLDLAHRFVALAEEMRNTDEADHVGDIIIALSTALGFFVHYRNDDASLEEVVDGIAKLVRYNATQADKALGGQTH